jgi:hypothetical protein
VGLCWAGLVQNCGVGRVASAYVPGAAAHHDSWLSDGWHCLTSQTSAARKWATKLNMCDGGNSIRRYGARCRQRCQLVPHQPARRSAGAQGGAPCHPGHLRQGGPRHRATPCTPRANARQRPSATQVGTACTASAGLLPPPGHRQPQTPAPTKPSTHKTQHPQNPAPTKPSSRPSLPGFGITDGADLHA